MPTPQKGYTNSIGHKIPSTTTIIGRFKDAGALMWWANRLAYEPYCECRAWMDSVLDGVPKNSTGMLSITGLMLREGLRLNSIPVNLADHRNFANKQAHIGTIVHARIDAHIRGVECDLRQFWSPKCLNPKAVSQTGFDAFLEWARDNKFKLAEGEMQLVSKKYGYGGTPDVIVVGKDKSVGDWKTGNLYPEQLLPQLAAYRNLLIENGHKVGKAAHAISVNKQSGGFTHRYFTPSEIDKGWEIFVKMNELYRMLKEFKA